MSAPDGSPTGSPTAGTQVDAAEIARRMTQAAEAASSATLLAAKGAGRDSEAQCKISRRQIMV